MKDLININHIQAIKELIKLVKEEIENCWFQEYSGANYRCRFCGEYDNHHKDCFVVNAQKLIGSTGK